MAKTYLLTSKRKAILKGKGCTLQCSRCKEPFNIGDVILSISSPRKSVRGKTMLYHAECYETMLIDLEKRGN